MRSPLSTWFGFVIFAAPLAAAEKVVESPLARGERITAVLAKEGFGPLRLNQSEKEVLQTIGEPRKRNPIVHIEATGLDVQDWQYKKLGLTLRMASSAGKGGPKFLAAIYARAQCPFATRRGIIVGNTQADVKKAYAGTEELYKPDLPGFDIPPFVVGSIFGGIVFEFTRGKVSGIFYGAYAECRTQPFANTRD